MYQVPSAAPSSVSLDQINPWLSIWLEPRATMRAILNSNPTYHVALLGALSGFGQALDSAAESRLGGDMNLPLLLIICAVAGGLLGVLGVHLWGALVRWTGSWLGGEGSPEEVRAAVAWGGVPGAWALLLWLPILALLGRDAFRGGLGEWALRLDTPAHIGLAALGLIEVVIGIWSIFTNLHCLGEAHRFSAWKALGASILAALVIALPFVCIVAALGA